ncbi:M20 family metallopeptidase [Halanaerobaculum tunisiense]
MINKLIKNVKEYVVELRREFHQYPEPSWKETRTAKRVKEELEAMNISYQTIAGTGVVAIIEGKEEGKTVALRADMDALEVEEENKVDYRSQNEGIMHACGHDGHTAMLLGAAKVLNQIKDQLTGRIKLIFQPAEEVAEGANEMITGGALDSVDNVFGIHLWADLPCGKVAVERGPKMASADVFKIEVQGKGGHGASPHQGVDSVVVGSAIVMNLQSLVSREFNPLESTVISVGKFNSGTRFNVIANKAVLEGTTRCFSKEVREQFPDLIKRVANNTAQSYRAEVEVEYTWGTPPTINDPAGAQIAQDAVIEMLDETALASIDPVMTAEDFALYLDKVPGAFAFVGVGNKEKEANYPHHHEKFNIDEDGLKIGTKLYVQYVINYLEKV